MKALLILTSGSNTLFKDFDNQDGQTAGEGKTLVPNMTTRVQHQSMASKVVELERYIPRWAIVERTCVDFR